MILSKLSTYWSRGLWKLLRPTELITGLVDGFRVAFNQVTQLSALRDAGCELPVGVGAGYRIISVPLSNIEYDGETDKYFMSGVPSGIVYFCKDPSTVGACAWFDFYEDAGKYVFSKDPATAFGVLSTDGTDCCSFLTFNAAQRNLGLQDIDNLYSNSCSHFVNQAIRQYDSEAGSCNGIDHRIVNAAAGVKTASDADSVVISWTEGGTRFELTDRGALLRKPIATEEELYILRSGNKLRYATTQPVSGEVRSIDTTYGSDDRGAQLAIQRRINPSASLVLYQRVALVAIPEQCSGVYLYYADTADGSDPIIEHGMRGRQLVYANLKNFGVSRVEFGDDWGSAVSCNGVEYGQPLQCGKYLKGVAYISAGKSLAGDSILSYERMSKPVLVHAGGCLVLVPEKQ